jgi:GNAT superfamily N-acetyltransferase
MNEARVDLGIHLARPDGIPGCIDIVRTLPDWFGIQSAIDDYARAIPSLPTLVAIRGGALIGFLTLKFHSDESAEVYLLAVRQEYHRRGTGSALLERAEQMVRERGCQFLQVKTLGPSHPSPEYAQTREFYRARGFVPLEELHDLWPGNPCLIMVKHLGSPTGSRES